MDQESINLCLVQSDIHPQDAAQNIKHYEMLLKSREIKSDLLVFPEMFSCGFSDDIVRIAQQHTQQSFDFLYRTSQKYGTDTVASLPVVAQNQRIYNRLVWVRENKIIAQYDKRHLFFGCEKQFCSAGTTRTIVQKNAWNILSLICYDIRFPLWCRNKYVDNALLYDCLLLIANFPASRSNAWRALLTARAIENQAYVIGVNRIGKDGYGNNHTGNTLIIDPLGEVVVEAPSDKEYILSVTLDHTLLNKLRNYFPVYEDWDT
ncbi:MAG: nitrilase family protein [Bacteroidales bacterium]|jgi:predicted amidohydrolase|nr:nitrilase family protein [Bacteroidales bacterium]